MAGVGLPLYLPKGARVIRTLQEWLRRDLYERGYEEVITPHIYNADVWKTSGHYGFYHENMYFFKINEGDDENPRMTEYGVKPMNCPGHVIIYKNELHSYRDLPLRYFEFGTVYRHEMSRRRARPASRPRLHPGRRPRLLHATTRWSTRWWPSWSWSTTSWPRSASSTRPRSPRARISPSAPTTMWEHATESLKEACARQGLAYDINEGDGAFYGPKIDIKVKDAIGRTWQCSTVQMDFNMPDALRADLPHRGQHRGDAPGCCTAPSSAPSSASSASSSSTTPARCRCGWPRYR